MKLKISCDLPIKQILSYTQENCGFLFIQQTNDEIIIKEFKQITNTHIDNFIHYKIGYFNYKVNYAYAKDKNLICVPFHTHLIGKQPIYPSLKDFQTAHKLSAVFINNRILFYNKTSVVYNFKIKLPLLDRILSLFL